MPKTNRIEVAIEDARCRLNEQANEAANKYKKKSGQQSYTTYTKCGAGQIDSTSGCHKPYQGAECEARGESNKRETRRRLNERADQALTEYTRYFKAA